MTDGTWQESFLAGQTPMAREGHTMVLVAPPDVTARRRRRRLLADDKEEEHAAAGASSSSSSRGGGRRRRLLARGGDSEVPNMSKALGHSNEWADGPTSSPPQLQTVEEDAIPTWLVLFGGVAEKGLVTGAQGGEGIFARRRRRAA